jgi:glucose-6-phosphate isomerase
MAPPRHFNGGYTSMLQHLTSALCATTTPLYEAALAALAPHHGTYQKAPLPHMALAEKQDDVAAMHQMARALAQDAQRIVILGTGGSSLGAQVLAQAQSRSLGPDLIFADNLDATSFAKILQVDMASTRFFVVSKSGGTAETMMQLGGALLALEAAGAKPSHHLAGIAGGGDNALRRLARAYEFPLLPHESDIGGRFSVLSNVGLLPAIWAGCDPEAVRAGAQKAMAGLQGAPQDFEPLKGAALHLAHMQAGRNVHVMMPYADALERLAFWHRQLWGESLGKGGHGSVPVNALGPVDQHSQLQLYLDGPDDKLYTLITHETRGQGAGVPDDFSQDPDLAALAGHAMGDLVDAEARATLDVLAEAKRPVRHIELGAIGDESLGEVLMHLQLETIYTADGLGVDAFSQPAVEAGKIRAKHYLQNGERKP